MTARQRDAAQPARSVYGENKHLQKLQKLPKSHNRERSNCTGLVLKQASMHGGFPFRPHPAADLASGPFPMEIFAVAVAPQSINVHNRKGAIALAPTSAGRERRCSEARAKPGVEKCDEQINVLGVPSSRLSVHNLKNLFSTSSLGFIAAFPGMQPTPTTPRRRSKDAQTRIFVRPRPS